MLYSTLPMWSLLQDYKDAHPMHDNAAIWRMNYLQNYFTNATHSPEAVSPQDVDRLLIPLRDRKPATRNRIRALLSAVLHWAAERDLVTGKLPLKKEPEHNQRTRRLSKAEEVQLFSSMDLDMRDLFYAALDTGLRKGALTKLKFKDIRGDTLVVPGAIQKQRESQIIPLTSRLKGIIARRQTGDLTDIIFKVEDFRKKWAYAKSKAGVTGLTWHDLRGEFASRLDEAGVEVSVTSQLLGHTNLTTTQRYLRPRVERFKDAIGKLGV